MKKTHLFFTVITLIIALSLLLNACAKSAEKPLADTTAPATALPLATQLGGSQSQNEIAALLQAQGASNTDIFREWTRDFSAVYANAKLTDAWVAPHHLQGDTFSCIDAWNDTHNFSDANCRLTAFLLTQNILTAEKADESYTGTYLVFDIDAIENGKRYMYAKNNLPLFTTLFGEKSPLKDEKIQDIYPRIWNEYGIQMQSDSLSLITVILHDATTNEIFVGHTGVLMPCDEGYLFVEKIAFEQPYQATKIKEKTDLMALFATRGEYFGEENETGPFVYENDKFLGKLTKNIAE